MRHDLCGCPFPGRSALPQVRPGEPLNADEESAVLSHGLRSGGPGYLQVLVEAVKAREGAGREALEALQTATSYGIRGKL